MMVVSLFTHPLALFFCFVFMKQIKLELICFCAYKDNSQQPNLLGKTKGKIKMIKKFQPRLEPVAFLL